MQLSSCVHRLTRQLQSFHLFLRAPTRWQTAPAGLGHGVGTTARPLADSGHTSGALCGPHGRLTLPSGAANATHNPRKQNPRIHVVTEFSILIVAAVFLLILPKDYAIVTVL